jgi:hypothetical protein
MYRFPTLQAIVDRYDSLPNPRLTDTDKSDLIAYLMTL